MRLLIDPDPPWLRWCRYSDHALSEGRTLAGPRWLGALRRRAGSLADVRAVGYRLRHGGDRVREVATRVTPASLGTFRECLRFLPEPNHMTYEAVRDLLDSLPDISHVVLCDTAFFLDLPAEASAYAVPAELRSRGVRRYGGSGLVHEWAARQATELCGRDARRVVSIELGDHPNLAALRDGRPVDTTMGFTPVEGLPSHTGCGDLDASVVFELRATGMSLREIDEMLSGRSGFRALVGRTCAFGTLVADGGGETRALARRILRYDIVRHVGAFAAVLGGVDAVAFSAADPRTCAGFVTELLRDLRPLGLRCGTPGRAGYRGVISEYGSDVKAVALALDSWRLLSERVVAFEKGEGV